MAMRLFKSILGLVLVVSLAACTSKPAAPGNGQSPGSGSGAPAQENKEPILIGVPLPLTGSLSTAGQQVLQGIQLGADEANKAGGLLGRQIKILAEDTKGEPNTAASVATKLVNQDKVLALIGGYGSTADFAMLQSIKQYKPLVIHAGSSAVKIENAFGKEPWYFHVYIWDYHRQKTASRFVESLQPKPQTVAIAFEDGLFGSDGAKFAAQYMKAAGLNVVMSEPFKSGSPDFSPILNRVKSLNPDVFYFIGYSGDNLQMVRQEKQFGVKPKATVVLFNGETRADYGDNGTGVFAIDIWSRDSKLDGLADWLKAMDAANQGKPTVSFNAQGYACIRTLIDAAKSANSLDREKLQAALAAGEFWTPFGKLKYQASEQGGVHQLLNDQSMVVLQFRDKGEEVVWPSAMSNGNVEFPAK
jgi:branched-chain amino acid transport system substrate-binding protein